MSVRMRQFVERQVIEALLDTVFAIPGAKVAVAEEGDFTLSEFRESKKDVLKELFALDEEHLLIKFWDGGTEVRGIVWLIYGNDGYDVISDYQVSLEPVMLEANLVADYWDQDGQFETFKEFKKAKLAEKAKA